MRLVLLGPPGAGKGTQAQVLCKDKGWAHLSSGDILRGEVKAGTELGAKAKAFMDAGQLVPDDLVVNMMVSRIARPDCAGGFVLDGFPRTAVQAEALDKALARSGRPLDGVVSLEVRDDEVVRRISGRRTCPQCGAIYHVQTLRPKVDDVCDRCGHRGLTQRADDREEVVGQRLVAYRRQTEPLIEYYRRAGLLEQVSAEQPIDQVRAELDEALGRRQGAVGGASA
ncbi:MAG: adenylate kinase [Phycisphaerae bacterium]|nr:adenylate kinase [Phycisphaerae bacterium]